MTLLRAFYVKVIEAGFWGERVNASEKKNQEEVDIERFLTTKWYI